MECWASAVVYPTTEEEIRAAVARAQQSCQKVKVVSGFSHTIPKLVCPSSVGESIVISTAKLNSHIEVDVENRRVTADSGVGLRALIDKVEAVGLSLVAAPYWEGFVVGKRWRRPRPSGGAPASCSGRESSGFAEIIELDGGDEAFNAAKISLGLLGVISKVTFSLEPAFKRSISLSFRDDGRLQDEFMELAGAHEFADITWYPSQHSAVYRLDDRVPRNSSGEGRTTSWVSEPPYPVLQGEKVNEAARSRSGVCAMAAVELAFKRLMANGLKNDGNLFLGYPVVGHQGRMQTSGSCVNSPASDVLNACAWDPSIRGLFFFETTAIFPASTFRGFVTDVKKLRDLRPEDFCGVDVYNGLLIRFIKASLAYLGQPEDSVAVDFNYFRADEPSTPRLNQDVWEEVEQMAFFKHRARPHWGKNRRVAFHGVPQKYPNFSEFQAVKMMLDPAGMFSSEWSDEILLGKEAADKEDGCAMEGLCICSEDRHCNPRHGYRCKPGLVYQEARSADTQPLLQRPPYTKHVDSCR
ncbi:unnamed protein product [Spirodela intermedia]|uniref:L-gulonolactone oxidase n=1 Tax=Spirodela intermedia TaxID=51605 RepID=A0A7I8J7F6_SPIIN|nr:unnamed protein product [Spirodela intermedia]CAA6666009.1 unnamed protein product [Spirodela intermedia]